MTDIETWIVSNGATGFETQALGVAEALGISPVIKRVNQPAPWRWLAPWGPVADAGDIAPPWPELVIAGGRQAIPFARMIRRRARGRTFVAIMQHPRVPVSGFDFVWAPRHDRLSGPNVFSTLLSPHRLTPQRLAAEAERIASDIAHLPSPRIAVLLGGTNAIFRFDARAAAELGAQLADLSRRYGAGLMVTPSRRTGAEQAARIAERIRDVPHVMWDGQGANPYFGYLGSAHTILVTCDSVNMVGEATASGKPVYVIELEGSSRKRREFFDAIYATGAARPFRNVIESWSYQPLNPTAEIADRMMQAIRARKLSGRKFP
jgi:mitochondrial fission protein ELM1